MQSKTSFFSLLSSCVYSKLTPGASTLLQLMYDCLSGNKTALTDGHKFRGAKQPVSALTVNANRPFIPCSVRTTAPVHSSRSLGEERESRMCSEINTPEDYDVVFNVTKIDE